MCPPHLSFYLSIFVYMCINTWLSYIFCFVWYTSVRICMYVCMQVHLEIDMYIWHIIDISVMMHSPTCHSKVESDTWEYRSTLCFNIFREKQSTIHAWWSIQDFCPNQKFTKTEIQYAKCINRSIGWEIYEDLQ